MKMKQMDGKPSRILRQDFTGRTTGGAPGLPDDACGRLAGRPSALELRRLSAIAYARVKQRGFVPGEDDDAWDDAGRSRKGRQRLVSDTDEWAFAEHEAQDWIDAEQEAQRMLVGSEDEEDAGR